jgi:hypothetical protein
MDIEEKLNNLTGDAVLLSMAARQNAVMGFRENGIDHEDCGNADLLLIHWIEGIKTGLSCDEYSLEVKNIFANIGITA